MDEEQKDQEQVQNAEPAQDDMGAIKVADEVLSIVAGLAASEVNGVYGMSGGIREGLTDMLGKQNFSKGIKVYTDGRTVRVEVHVIIAYGYNIPDVAIKLQEKVKEAVQNMTGYDVTGVDIHVEGVRKEKNKQLSDKDDTDELMKKWEDAEPDESIQTDGPKNESPAEPAEAEDAAEAAEPSAEAEVHEENEQPAPAAAEPAAAPEQEDKGEL